MSNVDETWASRDLPILVAAYRWVESDAPASMAQLEEMRRELGLPVHDFKTGLEALASADPPYIDVVMAGGWSNDSAGGGYVADVSERARRELGGWPSADALVDQLAAALVRAADDEPEPERRGRLREAAGVIGGK